MLADRANNAVKLFVNTVELCIFIYVLAKCLIVLFLGVTFSLRDSCKFGLDSQLCEI